MLKNPSSRSAASARNLKRTSARRLLLEHLEDRVLLAVRVWTGGGSTDNWTDAANWEGGVAPMSDDNLIFDRLVANGGQATKLTSFNDYAAGTRFRTVTLAESSYLITGNQILLQEGLEANYVSGTSTFDVPIQLAATQTFDVANPQAKLILADIDTGNLLTLTFDGPGTTQVGDGTAGNPGTISGDSSLIKYGLGTLYLYGDNTYKGLTTITQGTVNIRNDHALGDVNTPTVVNSYATLQLEGGRHMSEPLFIYGWGTNTDLDTSGALRSMGALDNTYSGLITLTSGDTAIAVDGPGRLVIDSQIIGDHANSDTRLYKNGPGTLELAGSDTNQITGTFYVRRGQVEFNKSGGAMATLGDVEIGEYIPLIGETGANYGAYGGDNSSRLVLMQDNQFPVLDYVNYSMRSVSLWPSGKMELGENVDQTIGNLVMFEGQRWSADVDIGGTGVLTMLGNLTQYVVEGTSGVSPAATITGNKLYLGDNTQAFGGGSNAPSTARTITVNDSAMTNQAVDLWIGAVIDGGSEVSLGRTGGGTLSLTAANTYQGPTYLGGGGTGIQVIGNNQAFGTGPLSMGDMTYVTNGQKITLVNPVITMDSDPRFLSPSLFGYDGSGDKGDFVFNQDVTMLGGRTFYVLSPNQTVTFNGKLSEGPFGPQALTKQGPGTMVLAGEVDITGTITVASDAGTLVLTGNAALSGTATNNPLAAPTGTLYVQPNSRLVLDNSVTNLADRIPDLMYVNLLGGTVELLGKDGEATSEVLGNVTYRNYTAVDVVSRVGTGALSSNKLTITTLAREGTAGAINFVGAVKTGDLVDGSLSAEGRNQIVLKNPPLAGNSGTTTTGGLMNGIFPSVTVQGDDGQYDLCTWVSADEGLKIVPFTDYVTDINQAGPTSNVKLTSPTATTITTVTRSINALVLGPGVALNGTSTSTGLTLNAGSLILNKGSSVNTPYLILSTAPTGYAFDSLWTVADDATGSDANSVAITGIVQGAVGITKAGSGRLILEPHAKGLAGEPLTSNEFTGAFIVDGGILNIRHGGALGAAPGTGSGYTMVMNGAALEIEDIGTPIEVPLEYLRVTGTGVNNQGVIHILDNPASSGQQIVWAGQISHHSFNAPSYVDGWTYGGWTNERVIGITEVQVDGDANFKIAGPITADGQLVKTGPGTLEFDGTFANTYNVALRAKEGTLILNKPDGIMAHGTGGYVFVGDDDPTTPPATLRLLGDLQIHPDAPIRVSSDGTLDIGHTKQIIESLDLVIGPQGGSQVTMDPTGELTFDSGGNTISVHSIGIDNANGGAAILGGTINLAIPQATLALTRTFLVNRGLSKDWTPGVGLSGVDLTVTSAITDGSPLTSNNVAKSGFGTMEFGGTQANTFSGNLYVYRGTLLLNKNDPTSSGAAFGGGLQVGDEDMFSGGRQSDVVRILRPGQVPDMTTPIVYYTNWPAAGYLVRGSGWLDVGHNNVVLGGPNFQNGLILSSAGVVTTEADGSLGINGNLVGYAGWYFVPGEVRGNVNFNTPGSAGRTIDVTDQGSLPYELAITGSVNSPASIGIFKTNTGGLLLAGDSGATLASDLYVQNGVLGIGHDNALGTGQLSIASYTVSAEYGARTIGNQVSLDGNAMFGNNAIGGGNDLTITGGATLTDNRTLYVVKPNAVTFAGGIGEMIAGRYMNKSGIGRLVLAGPTMNSGSITINNGSGAIILRDAGTLENASSIVVAFGGTLQIETNASPIQVDRIRDLTPITLQNGSLVYRGAPGVAKNGGLGAITVAANQTGTIISEVPATGSVNLTFPSLTMNISSTLNLVGMGSPIGSATNKVKFATAPTLVNGILPNILLTSQTLSGLATVLHNDLATYTADGVAIPTYVDINVAGPSDNVKVTANQTLPADKTINALVIEGNGVTLGGPGQLTVRTGTVLTSSPFNVRGSNAITTANLTLSRSPFVITDRGTQLQVDSTVGGTGLITTAGRGTLVLTGANTFTGGLTIGEGIVNVQNDQALGSTAGGTTVIWGAQLQLEKAGMAGLTIGNEPLTISGAGVSTGLTDNTGAVKVMPGTGVVTWGTGLTAIAAVFRGTAWDTPIAINVKDAGDSLILNGTVNFNAAAGGMYFYKYGDGTLELRGGASNTQANNPNFQVAEGTLVLNKSGTGVAFPSSGTLIIGDDLANGVAAENVDRVIMANDNQLISSATVQVRSTAIWQFAGHSQWLNPTGTALTTQLYMYNAPTAAADIDLGGGTLRLGDTNRPTTIKVANIIGLGGPVAPRLYNGTVIMPTNATASGTFIDVDDSQPRQDFRLDANITGAGNITKNRRDSGVQFSGDNSTWTGNINVQSDDNAGAPRGELWITRSEAMGSGTTGTVTLINGQSLILAPDTSVAPNIIIGSGRTLAGEGTGFQAQGMLHSISGDNEWRGPVNLGSGQNAYIGVDAGTLTLSGKVTSNTKFLYKVLPGTLILGGNQSNSLNNNVYIWDGTLKLNKTGGTQAITGGNLYVGNDAGAKRSDALEFLQDNQLSGVYVIVASTGYMKLNDHSQTVGPLYLNMSTVLSSEVDTGTNPLTTLTLAGTQQLYLRTVNTVPLYATSPAKIYGAGVLDLGASLHSFDFADGGSLVDLEIDTRIAAASTGGLTKANAGTLLLNADNSTYAGHIQMSAGHIAIGGTANAYGPATTPLEITGQSGIFALGGPQTFSNPINLSHNIILEGAVMREATAGPIVSEGLTVAGNINLIGGNRTIYTHNAAPTAITGDINLGDSTTNWMVNFDVRGMAEFSVSGSILDNPGFTTTGSVTKANSGRMDLSSPASTYRGITTISGGILNIQNPAALGTTAGNTVVASGAVLQLDLDDGGSLAEPVTINGVGYLGAQYAPQPTGALTMADRTPGTSATNTLTGNITLGSTNAGVGALGAEDRLVLDNVIGVPTATNFFTLWKLAPGTLEMAGASANTYLGGTVVGGGTLLLNKSSNVDGAATGTGNLFIGDDVGSQLATRSGLDRIVYGANATADNAAQISKWALVTIASSGKLDVDGKQGSIGGLVLYTGSRDYAGTGYGSSALVEIDGGALTLNGSGTNLITVNTIGYTDGSTTPAQITATGGGQLLLAPTAAPTIVINDTLIPSAAEDLVIAAPVGMGATPTDGTYDPAGYIAGIREGRNQLNNNDDGTLFNSVPGGSRIQNTPVLGETNVVGTIVQPVSALFGPWPTQNQWANNETWIYTGQIYDADGKFQLAENIDDRTQVLIDGVRRMMPNTYNHVSTTASPNTQQGTGTGVTTFVNDQPAGGMTDFGPGQGGWHDIEVRFSNGTGGGGAVADVTLGWTTAMGFGYRNSDIPSWNGSEFMIPAGGNLSVPTDGMLRTKLDLNLNGTGTLALTAASPLSHDVTVAGGTLKLRDGGSLANAGSIRVESGASFIIDDFSGAAMANRFNDTAPVTLRGGSLTLIGDDAGTTEDIGMIQLAANTASQIRVEASGSVESVLSPLGIERAAGASLSLSTEGSDLGSLAKVFFDSARVGFANPMPATAPILPYATMKDVVGRTDFVTDVDAGGDISLGAFTAYDTNINSIASGVVRLSAGASVLSGPQTIKGLLLDGAVSLDVGVNTLTFDATLDASPIVSVTGASSISGAGSLAFGDNDGLWLAETDLAIGASLSGAATAPMIKQGDGRVVLSADNSGLLGPVVVDHGAVKITNAGALGPATAGTRVNSGAVLEIEGSNLLIAEPLQVLGGGNYDYADNKFPGAVRQTSTGSNTLSGTLTLETTSSTRLPLVMIGVDSGKLVLTNAIQNSTDFPTMAGSLTKYGIGTLDLAGSAINTMSGTLTIADGTMILNKSVGGASLPSGSLVVGDGRGGFRSDERVEYGVSAATDQLAGAVTITRSGLLDAKGKSDGITSLTIYDGKFTTNGGNYSANGVTMTGGLIETTGNAIFTLNGTLTYTGGAQGAITGQLCLQNAGSRVFSIADGPSIYDFDIPANIVTSRRLEKQGAGVLLLRGDNRGLMGVNEQQTFRMADSVTQFNMVFGGFMTPAINYEVSDADLTAILESLPSLGKGNVTATSDVQAPNSPRTWTIRFVNGLAGLNMQLGFANVVSGTGTIASGEVNGDWSLYLNGAGQVALGSDTAAGSGSVVVGGSGGLWAYGSERYVRTFSDNASTTVTLGGRREWGGNYPLYISNSLMYTAGGSVTYQVDDPQTPVQIGGNTERQLIYFPSNVTTGSWKLKFDPNGATSTALLPGMNATDVYNAIKGIAPAGAEFVVEQGTGPYAFKVTFIGNQVNRDVWQLQIVNNTTTITTATVFELVRGGGSSHSESATSNPVAAVNNPAVNAMLYSNLNKTGAGTLVFGGPSAYSGATAVVNGALVVKTDGALGDSFDYDTNGNGVQDIGEYWANKYARANVTVGATAGGTSAALVLDPRDDNGDVMGPITITDRGLIALSANPPRYASGALNNFQGLIRNVAGDNRWNAGPYSEVETINFNTKPTAGTWTITFNGATTAAITGEGDAATVETRLRALSNISAAAVFVTGNATSGYRIAFGSTLRNLPQNRFVVTLGGMTGITATVTESVRGMDGFDLRSISTATTNDATFFFGADAGRLDLVGDILSSDSGANFMTPGNVATQRNSTRVAKVGPGTIATSGDQANSYWGDTMVFGGTWELNKAPTRAVPAGTYLYIGDHIDAFWAAGTDRVLMNAPGQLPDSVVIVMGPSGRLETSTSFGTRNTNDVQQIAFSALPTAGTWNLDLDPTVAGIDVSGIPYNATAGQLEYLINTSNWGLLPGNQVTVGGGGTLFIITFMDAGGVGQRHMPVVQSGTLSGATITATHPSLGGLTGVEGLGALSGRIGASTSSQINIGSGQLSLGADISFTLFPGSVTTIGAQITGPGKLGLLNSQATIAGSRTITVNSSGASEELRITAPVVDGSVSANEVQTIAFRTAPTSGTFTITYGTSTTSPIAFGANAATMQTALNAILPGSTAGAQCSVATVGNNYTYAITFTNALGFLDVPALTLNDSALVGHNGYKLIETLKGGPMATSNEIQTITLPTGLTQGSWWISYNGETTATPLAYNAAVADVQAALESLTTIGANNVAVQQGATANVFVVIFQNALAAQDASLLQLSPGNFGPANLPTIVETTRGAMAPYAGSLVRVGQIGSRMVMAGAGSYQGLTTINANAGVINVRDSNGLGIGTGVAATGIVVNSGGALELEGGVTLTDKPLTINGMGAAPGIGSSRLQSIGTTALNTGAIRSISGDNTIAETSVALAALPTAKVITFAGSSSINVDAGTLTIRGAIDQGADRLLAKIGPGTLQEDSIANALTTGNTGSGGSATYVLEGTLVLNKLANDAGVNIALYVGDDRSTDNTARVIYGPGAGANQIADTAALTIRGGGLFDISAVTLGEVQTITLPAMPAAGNWSVSYDGYWSDPLPFNAKPAQVEAAVENMLVQGGYLGADVSVTNGANPWIYLFQFGGSMAGQDLLPLQAAFSGDFFPTATTVVGAETVRGGFKTIGALNLAVGRLSGGHVVTGVNTININGNVTGYTVGGNTVYNPATIEGKIALNNGSRNLQAWDNPGDVVLDISASIADGINPWPVAAAANVTKLGGGTAFLRGSSTYNGLTTIQEGMLVAGADAAFGSAAGSTTVWNTATLAFRGNINYTTMENIQLGNVASTTPIRVVNRMGDNYFGGVLGVGYAPLLLDSLAGSLHITGTLGAGSQTVSTTGDGGIGLDGQITVANLDLGNAATTVGEEGMLSFDTLTLAAGKTFSISGTIGDAMSVASLAGSTTVNNGGTFNFATLSILPAGSMVVNGTAGVPSSSIDLDGSMAIGATGHLKYNLVDLAGNLTVNGIAEGGTIAAAAGASVKGTGTIAGDLATSGTLRGGDDIGILRLNGATTLGAGSGVAVSLGGESTGQYSQLSVGSGGSLVLGNTDLQVALSGTFIPAVGNHFTVIKNATGAPVTGLFYYGGAALQNGDGFDVPIPGGGTVPLRIFYDSGATHDVVLVRQDTLAVSSIRVDAGAGDLAGGLIYDSAHAEPWNGTGQRSTITRMVVTFNGIVDGQTDAFTLYSQGSLAAQGMITEARDGLVPLSVTLDRVGEQTIATIAFADSGAGNRTYNRNGVWALNDDNYLLTIKSDKLRVDHGTPMASDLSDSFFRWFGDVDGDRDVDGGDLFKFRAASGSPGMGPNAQALDYDGDGDIDNGDYLQFRRASEGYLRFGARLLPP